MAYKTEIVEYEGVLYLKIPEHIAESYGLDAESILSIKENNRKSFLVNVEAAKEGGYRCIVCFGENATNECQLCGEYVCSSCFWSMAKICSKCKGEK